MKVSELIELLKLISPEAEIELYEQRYNGGGDPEFWTEPVFFTLLEE